ncbi:MAG: VWA domain-containing protein, partial [Bacillota bacterium]
LLLLLLLFPLVLAIKRSRPRGAVRYPTVSHLQDIKPTWRVKYAPYLPWLTVTAAGLLIIALARPQVGRKELIVRQEGIDILLTLDVSTSMLAEDFKRGQNRLDSVKEVTRRFIAKRPNDRIGMVIFAGRPYILSPLTWDHDWCQGRLAETKTGMIEDGTAIGSALATAINRLRESKAKSKVIILLTDGSNNAGAIQPQTAAEAAQALGVTIYTIGAGSQGLVPYPVIDKYGNKHYQQVQIDLDEDLLKSIAQTTRGQYFRATDSQSLRQIFAKIDRMQKTVIKMPQYLDYQDLYPYFLLGALMLLLAEAILANTVFRRLP